MDQPSDTLLHRIIGPRLVTRPASPVCEQCGSDAVAVVDWDEPGDGQWRVVLRCGQCEKWHEMTMSATAADRLAATVDTGIAAIERDLQAIDRERMAVQVEAFAEALARDLIDAQDFERR